MEMTSREKKKWLRYASPGTLGKERDGRAVGRGCNKKEAIHAQDMRKRKDL